MKRLLVTAYWTERVVHSAKVVVELASDSVEINAARLQELIDIHCVDWEVLDASDECIPDFDVQMELADSDTRSLPVIPYSPTSH